MISKSTGRILLLGVTTLCVVTLVTPLSIFKEWLALFMLVHFVGVTGASLNMDITRKMAYPVAAVSTVPGLGFVYMGDLTPWHGMVVTLSYLVVFLGGVALGLVIRKMQGEKRFNTTPMIDCIVAAIILTGPLFVMVSGYAIMEKWWVSFGVIYPSVALGAGFVFGLTTYRRKVYTGLLLAVMGGCHLGFTHSDACIGAVCLNIYFIALFALFIAPTKLKPYSS